MLKRLNTVTVSVHLPIQKWWCLPSKFCEEKRIRAAHYLLNRLFWILQFPSEIWSTIVLHTALITLIPGLLSWQSHFFDGMLFLDMITNTHEGLIYWEKPYELSCIIELRHGRIVKTYGKWHSILSFNQYTFIFLTVSSVAWTVNHLTIMRIQCAIFTHVCEIAKHILI